MNILIIEDEQKVAKALKEGLEHKNYKVDLAPCGEDGFFLLNSRQYDLLILDLMLPGRDGIEILKTLRKNNLDLPVLILTARDTVEDRVLGLNSGADDYLIKPFAFPELLARIRALLKRGREKQTTHLNCENLEMDLIKRKITRGENDITLTLREYDLLEYLLRHQNQIVSREMLTTDVWQESNRATPMDNLIDVHIARLRKKIDDPYKIKLLHTIRGVGFIISGEAP